MLEGCDILIFLMLTKPACDRSLVASIDPLVCGMDVTTTFIAWNTMLSFKDMVFQYFKENTNVFFFNLAVLLIFVKLFYRPKFMYFYVYV